MGACVSCFMHATHACGWGAFAVRLRLLCSGACLVVSSGSQCGPRRLEKGRPTFRCTPTTCAGTTTCATTPSHRVHMVHPRGTERHLVMVRQLCLNGLSAPPEHALTHALSRPEPSRRRTPRSNHRRHASPSRKSPSLAITTMTSHERENALRATSQPRASPDVATESALCQSCTQHRHELTVPCLSTASPSKPTAQAPPPSLQPPSLA